MKLLVVGMTLVMFILKLLGMITVSWFIVFLPLTIYLTLWVILFVLMLIVGIIGAMLD